MLDTPLEFTTTRRNAFTNELYDELEASVKYLETSGEAMEELFN